MTYTSPEALARKFSGNKRPQADPVRYIEKPRVCLTCSREFVSSWIGNRRCDKCKIRGEYERPK